MRSSSINKSILFLVGIMCGSLLTLHISSLLGIFCSPCCSDIESELGHIVPMNYVLENSTSSNSNKKCNNDNDDLVDKVKMLRQWVAKLEREKLEKCKEVDYSKQNTGTGTGTILDGDGGINNEEHNPTAYLQVDSLPIQPGGKKIHSEDSVCRGMPLALPSSETIWMENIGAIFRQSKHRRDPDWNFKEFTTLLMNLLPPSTLRKSIKTPPSQDAMRNILGIVQKRRDYFASHDVQKDDNNAPPPLKVLVMGGSVTMGVMCRDNPENIKAGRFFRYPCAWPWRLNHLINDLLKFEAVQIENAAQGGLNTKIGERVFDFQLYPDSFLPHGPDIIINAFSSNDMHVLTMNEASSQNLTLSDALFEMNENFVRKVLSSRQKNPPLLVYFDDYLGNEQNNIKELMSFGNTVSQLSSYYPIMFVSYADAVRHLVYGSVEEAWFSPPWVGEDGWERQIHPGMGAHISMVWIFAFNILNAVVSFCNEEAYSSCAGNLSKCNDVFLDVSNSTILQGPKPIPSTILPALTDDIKLETLSSKWRNQDVESSTVYDDKLEVSRNCKSAWIVGVSLKEEKELKLILDEFVTFSSGWNVELDNGKLGLAPTSGLGSKMTLAIDNNDGAFRTLHILAMKSYGDEWSNSTARFTVYTNDEMSPIFQEDIYGYHQSKTSVTYAYKFDLNYEGKAEKLNLTIELVGGNKFKVTGMGLCSH